jgi:phosphoribosyl-AMP cyclohydrolase
MNQPHSFSAADIAALKFDSTGLIAAIVQSANSKRVLMMAWMNAESLALTLERGETVFWSRSRQELWHKGATSGNTQLVHSIEVDCDADALLIQVTEAGPACHNGTESCFDTQTIYSNLRPEADK